MQVEVAYTGICGTDLHVLHGEMDARVTPPAVLGHEMSGVVAALGDGVTGWAVGDHVAVVPLTWDGTCPACRAGHEHVCHHLRVSGVDLPGALQRLWNVRADQLVALPADLPLDHAALVEPTAVAVARRSARRRWRRATARSSSAAARSACSSPPWSGTRAATWWSWSSIPAAGRPSRHSASTSLIPSAVDLSTMGRATGRAAPGRTSCSRCSGSAAAALAATDLVRVRGTVVIVAIHPEPRPVDLHRVFLRELRVVGARVHQRADFERAVELLAAGAIPADGLITHIAPLSATAEAFAALESGQEMKVLIDLAQSSDA